MTIEVHVPDIGDFSEVDVIEVSVAPGDTVAVEDTLLTLETDKATMDIPSPVAGTIETVLVKEGDKVSKGTLIIKVSAAGQAQTAQPEVAAPEAATPPQAAHTASIDVHVPDIGDFSEVDVIEVSVAPGDSVDVEDSLMTLETDKATMDIPSPVAGTVEVVLVRTGDKVSKGTLIVKVQGQGDDTVSQPQAAAPESNTPPAQTAPAQAQLYQDTAHYRDEPVSSDEGVHAGPATRRLARELGVSLSQVPGSGRRGRVLLTDIHQHVKQRLSGGGGTQGSGLSIAPAKPVDFTRFGEVTEKPLSRIKQLTAEHLHRNWVTIPHVTQFDEADITSMEAFRREQKATAEQMGFKLTPIVFVMKAVVNALRTFPQFNSSLSPDGQHLIEKRYYNIGVAVDTPNGLVVPVIRHVDAKSLYQLAHELKNFSEKARGAGLSAEDMSGSCFTISSLGGIGGTAFTPIINAPDVAILGLSRAAMKPVYQDGAFVPRLTMPLSLSYDHRVIDGAEAARFTQHVAQQLSDIRQLLL